MLRMPLAAAAPPLLGARCAASCRVLATAASAALAVAVHTRQGVGSAWRRRPLDAAAALSAPLNAVAAHSGAARHGGGSQRAARHGGSSQRAASHGGSARCDGSPQRRSMRRQLTLGAAPDSTWRRSRRGYVLPRRSERVSPRRGSLGCSIRTPRKRVRHARRVALTHSHLPSSPPLPGLRTRRRSPRTAAGRRTAATAAACEGRGGACVFCTISP